MPLAPQMMAVSPLIDGPNVGRLWYIPSSWRGKFLEPMMARFEFVHGVTNIVSIPQVEKNIWSSKRLWDA
jgi:hypothetical protein